MSSQGEMRTYLALTGNSIAGDVSNKSGTNPDCSNGVTSVLVNKDPADERPNWSRSMPAEMPTEKNIGAFVLGNTPNSAVPALSAEEALTRFEAKMKGKSGVQFKPRGEECSPSSEEPAAFLEILRCLHLCVQQRQFIKGEMLELSFGSRSVVENGSTKRRKEETI
ncbi:hypothetical protein BS47DRAFT_1368206 [Hydnum rufescens UP504]|uniref:Uncharacterized protein n=1 Tax=Hydnum rufescens UP504 TaxID=1448309 RepID=A0A9P6AGP6_9AGAM|nr:hypothetical protein BS47DRAFT_1368206 [Hydnum rufescens UP504]